ncbi:Double-stranded RNA binding motif [Carpediemonas membranifera]|uniref:Double-stranded RNA binding motif n=1 Tax=Carpediemonas membranifera TaxID=201153 RepID=A0A8J6E262_9EUKA|nr:Double-stranded RNA binding motif [Carpediemonas membranifera]|eukprot:KAG9393911.1 Double-stranded RNA binding motif [Carpediemonas membranifera]
MQGDHHQIQLELSHFFRIEWSDFLIRAAFDAESPNAVTTGKIIYNTALALLAMECNLDVMQITRQYSIDTVAGMFKVFGALSQPDVLPLSTFNLQDRFPKLFYFLLKADSGGMSGLMDAIVRLDIYPEFKGIPPQNPRHNADRRAPVVANPGEDDFNFWDAPVNPPRVAAAPAGRAGPPPPVSPEFVAQRYAQYSHATVKAEPRGPYVGRAGGPHVAPGYITASETEGTEVSYASGTSLSSGCSSLDADIMNDIPRNSPGYQMGLNYKGVLNEYCQKNGLNLPLYETRRKMDPSAPDHAPRFSSTVKVSNPTNREVLRASALGRNKKEAEFRAAYKLIMTRMADEVIR